MATHDKNGSELKVGDTVNVTGKVAELHGDHVNIVVEGCPWLHVKGNQVAKEGETDTAKAARAGFSSK